MTAGQTNLGSCLGTSLKWPNRKICNLLIFNNYSSTGCDASRTKSAISRQNAVPGADFDAIRGQRTKKNAPDRAAECWLQTTTSFPCQSRNLRTVCPFTKFSPVIAEAVRSFASIVEKRAAKTFGEFATFLKEESEREEPEAFADFELG